MKIHITGASSAGSTTLGSELTTVLSCPYFDTDDYFWLWLKNLPCPVLEILGDTSVSDRLTIIQGKLNQFAG